MLVCVAPVNTAVGGTVGVIDIVGIRVVVVDVDVVVGVVGCRVGIAGVTGGDAGSVCTWVWCQLYFEY